MASIYCQELIRNSLYLCQAYIGNMMNRSSIQLASSKSLMDNYYVESDKELLELLTSNCLPILKDMMSQVDKFNSHNQLDGDNNETSEFEMDLSDLIARRDDFSIKQESAKGLQNYSDIESGLSNVQRKSLVVKKRRSRLARTTKDE